MIYISAQDEVSVCSGISALFHLSHCKQSREILILIACKPISVITCFIYSITLSIREDGLNKLARGAALAEMGMFVKTIFSLSGKDWEILWKHGNAITVSPILPNL